jgi:hypothetical protein
MSDEKIALLKTLALRPSQHVASRFQPMLDEMVEAGCLTFGPAGWMTTAYGCAVIERERGNIPARRKAS